MGRNKARVRRKVTATNAFSFNLPSIPPSTATNPQGFDDDFGFKDPITDTSLFYGTIMVNRPWGPPIGYDDEYGFDDPLANNGNFTDHSIVVRQSPIPTSAPSIETPIDNEEDVTLPTTSDISAEEEIHNSQVDGQAISTNVKSKIGTARVPIMRSLLPAGTTEIPDSDDTIEDGNGVTEFDNLTLGDTIMDTNNEETDCGRELGCGSDMEVNDAPDSWPQDTTDAGGSTPTSCLQGHEDDIDEALMPCFQETNPSNPIHDPGTTTDSSSVPTSPKPRDSVPLQEAVTVFQETNIIDVESATTHQQPRRRSERKALRVSYAETFLVDEDNESTEAGDLGWHGSGDKDDDDDDDDVYEQESEPEEIESSEPGSEDSDAETLGSEEFVVADDSDAEDFRPGSRKKAAQPNSMHAKPVMKKPAQPTRAQAKPVEKNVDAGEITSDTVPGSMYDVDTILEIEQLGVAEEEETEDEEVAVVLKTSRRKSTSITIGAGYFKNALSVEQFKKKHGVKLCHSEGEGNTVDMEACLYDRELGVARMRELIGLARHTGSLLIPMKDDPQMKYLVPYGMFQHAATKVLDDATLAEKLWEKLTQAGKYLFGVKDCTIDLNRLFRMKVELDRLPDALGVYLILGAENSVAQSYSPYVGLSVQIKPGAAKYANRGVRKRLLREHYNEIHRTSKEGTKKCLYDGWNDRDNQVTLLALVNPDEAQLADVIQLHIIETLAILNADFCSHNLVADQIDMARHTLSIPAWQLKNCGLAKNRTIGMEVLHLGNLLVIEAVKAFKSPDGIHIFRAHFKKSWDEDGGEVTFWVHDLHMRLVLNKDTVERWNLLFHAIPQSASTDEPDVSAQLFRVRLEDSSEDIFVRVENGDWHKLSGYLDMYLEYTTDDPKVVIKKLEEYYAERKRQIGRDYSAKQEIEIRRLREMEKNGELQIEYGEITEDGLQPDEFQFDLPADHPFFNEPDPKIRHKKQLQYAGHKRAALRNKSRKLAAAGLPAPKAPALMKPGLPSKKAKASRKPSEKSVKNPGS